MAYTSALSASGGKPPYTWYFISGTLPPGLAGASSGNVSGTVVAATATGNYIFTAQVQDSSGTATTSSFVLPVNAPTGAVCNNISFNVAGSSSPLTPISDLGSNTYLGSTGGLYGNGSNDRPASHDAAGVATANTIVPLDAYGNPDPVNGSMVLLSIGTSDAEFPFRQFISTATADPLRNPRLQFINGAQGSETAKKMADPTSAYWSTIVNFFLPQAGFTPNQVVAAWVDILNSNPSGVYPGDMVLLQSQLESIAQNLHTKFPNLKLAYFSSAYYSGYSNGLSITDPEPYAYESAFPVRNAILDQINGSPALNYDPKAGAVLAPWMAWGPYLWANGLLPRSDGLLWGCQDFMSDGVHPTNPAGRVKITSYLLNFFKTDPTTAPWFLAH